MPDYWNITRKMIRPLSGSILPYDDSNEQRAHTLKMPVQETWIRRHVPPTSFVVVAGPLHSANPRPPCQSYKHHASSHQSYLLRRRTDIIPSAALRVRLDAVDPISLSHVGTAAAAGRRRLPALAIEHVLPSVRREAAAGATTPVFRLRACSVALRHRDPSVLASALDAFVAVLVQRRKIFPQLFIRRRDRVAFPHRRELEGQSAKGFGMELVLMRL